MVDNYGFQIRLTGVLIENNNILLVKQKLSESRKWSLPGGRLEHGETIEEGITREMHEETGITTSIEKLLYICDVENSKTPLVHITFLLKRVAGHLTMPTNEHDDNPIHDVKFVPITKLNDYGFSQKFIDLAMSNFNNSGSYLGYKSNIGLAIK